MNVASPASPLWPFALYFLAVVFLAAAMLVLSFVLGGRHGAPQKGEPYESGVVSVGSARLRWSVKYYLVAMFFVVFDLESVFLIAWAISVRQDGWPGFVEAIIFIGILLAALIYLWRLGALDWGSARRHSRQH